MQRTTKKKFTTKNCYNFTKSCENSSSTLVLDYILHYSCYCVQKLFDKENKSFVIRIRGTRRGSLVLKIRYCDQTTIFTNSFFDPQRNFLIWSTLSSLTCISSRASVYENEKKKKIMGRNQIDSSDVMQGFGIQRDPALPEVIRNLDGSDPR